MSGEVELTDEKLIISEDVVEILRKSISPIGNGAHVLCPKEHVGKTAYIVVCKE